MYWELWHRPSGNLIADFDGLSDGLAFVARELGAGGEAAVREWELLRTDGETPPLREEDLVVTALVVLDTAPTDRSVVERLAERIALRLQHYEGQVEQLERRLAAMRG